MRLLADRSISTDGSIASMKLLFIKMLTFHSKVRLKRVYEGIQVENCDADYGNHLADKEGGRIWKISRHSLPFFQTFDLDKILAIVRLISEMILIHLALVIRVTNCQYF